MKIFLLIFAVVLLSHSEAFAFCKNQGHYNQCSDLNKVSAFLEQGNLRDYADYLPYPAIFQNERLGVGVSKEKIQAAKRFLKAAMEPAKDDPLLAFYVGSVIRKGHWALEGYGYGYGAEQHDIYRKQIKYFEKSLSMRDEWDRETAAKVLGNIYFYGLLKPYANPYPLYGRSKLFKGSPILRNLREKL